MRRTPTSQSAVVVRTSRAELRGDGPAVDHLGPCDAGAVRREAVNRRMATQPSGIMCSPGPGK
eukprot:289724-Prymnesium_polylepis.1